jgi:hypothetical protein
MAHYDGFRESAKAVHEYEQERKRLTSVSMTVEQLSQLRYLLAKVEQVAGLAIEGRRTRATELADIRRRAGDALNVLKYGSMPR